MYAWNWHVEWQTPAEFHAHAIKRIYAEAITQYQRVLVVEFDRFGKGLIIDGKIQSTVADEFIYHETLVHPLLLSLDNPKKVLILGGGEGATIREVLKHKSVESIIMVDIDKAVIDFAKEYLKEWHQGSFDNPKVRVIIGDGYQFVKSTNEKFDAIILDLTDPQKGSTSVKLYTIEFYRRLKEILSPNGGIVTQATSPSFSLNVYSTIYNTIKNVFKYVSAGIAYVPSFDGLWGFIYASDARKIGDMSPEEVDSKLRERVSCCLKFYDGLTNLSIFTIPKYIREYIEKETNVSTQQNPVYVPA